MFSSVDSAVCTSIKAAANAGVASRDAYMFPCKCSLMTIVLLLTESIFFVQPRPAQRVPPPKLVRW
jgi:hypothetical protein